VEWVLIFIEGRSKGITDVNICIETAPRRMRKASRRDMTRTNEGIIAGKVYLYRCVAWDWVLAALRAKDVGNYWAQSACAESLRLPRSKVEDGPGRLVVSRMLDGDERAH
jgi:hypothetical protein